MDTDLSILSGGLDRKSDSDIYLSTLADPGNNFDTDADTTKACTSYGFDICILSGKEIQALKDYVYFAVKCYEKCNTYFRV